MARPVKDNPPLGHGQPDGGQAADSHEYADQHANEARSVAILVYGQERDAGEKQHRQTHNPPPNSERSRRCILTNLESISTFQSFSPLRTGR